MTDEMIKEEFEKWGYNSETTSMEDGFYAGFRSAERLAKIEARERINEMRGELLKISQYPIASVCEEARTIAMEAWKKSKEYTE